MRQDQNDDQGNRQAESFPGKYQVRWTGQRGERHESPVRSFHLLELVAQLVGDGGRILEISLSAESNNEHMLQVEFFFVASHGSPRSDAQIPRKGKLTARSLLRLGNQQALPIYGIANIMALPGKYILLVFFLTLFLGAMVLGPLLYFGLAFVWPVPFHRAMDR